MAGNVDDSAGIVVINQRAPPEHVIQHAENGFFIPRNDARGKNHAVVFIHGNKPVIVHGDSRKRRHRLRLAATCQNNDALRIESANVLRANDHSIRNLQNFQGVRDLHVVDHAAPDERHFAAHARPNVDDLLNAMNRRSEARQNHAPRCRAAQFFNSRNDSPLRWRKPGALHVRRIAEQCQHSLRSVFGERVQIKRRAAHRCLIDLKIPSVNHHAERRANRQRHAIHRAVRHGNEFNFIRPDLHQPPGQHFAQRARLQQARFIQPLFHQRQRETRPVHRNVQIAQDIRQRPDVIFMPVRQHNRANVRAVLFQVSDVGNDQVDAQELRFREHHARVDDDDLVAEPQCHHVHSEFAEATQGDGGEGLRGLAQ